MADGQRLLATLLRHESKTNSYKFALIRALNDLALEYPCGPEPAVVVPLSRVAERWLVSYWPFVGDQEVQQGARPLRDGVRRQDMSFRPALTRLRQAWEALPHTRSHPAEGALLLADYRVGRGRLPPELETLTAQTLAQIAQAVKQPLRFAGLGGTHQIFSPPALAVTLPGHFLPGTQPSELAFTVPALLWKALQELSLWVEALCLQEWSLFVERVDQSPKVSRGEVFMRLTAMPDARSALTWERNQVRLMLLEGQRFSCPWTGKVLGNSFDLDHIIPLSVHPINELWNLVPSDPQHNQQVKRDRIPREDRLLQAVPSLRHTYAAYAAFLGTATGFQADIQGRFGQALTADQLAEQVIGLSGLVASARNVPRY